MAKYEALCAQYGAEMNSQPALVAAERKLKEKITIMCLVALVSSCASRSDMRCRHLQHWWRSMAGSILFTLHPWQLVEGTLYGSARWERRWV